MGESTEAALFPLLSKAITESWAPLSILYVTPIKALLNNQETRLHKLSGMVGRRAFKWHGDVSDSWRKKRSRTPSRLPTKICRPTSNRVRAGWPGEALRQALRAIRYPQEFLIASRVAKASSDFGIDLRWPLLLVISAGCCHSRSGFAGGSDAVQVHEIHLSSCPVPRRSGRRDGDLLVVATLVVTPSSGCDGGGRHRPVRGCPGGSNAGARHPTEARHRRSGPGPSPGYQAGSPRHSARALPRGPGSSRRRGRASDRRDH
jgi:hypothetical protein